MIPTEIRNVETKIAESNRKKLVLALSNFAGMVFGALIAVVKEMRLQNDFKKIQEKWKEDLGFGTDDSEGQLIPKCPFHCLQISQKTNAIFIKISALDYKKRSNKKVL